MDPRPRGYDTALALIARGVTIPNPLTLDIDDAVDIDSISTEGVTIHAGCRIRGASTVISTGCTLGAEGPVTLDSCRLGPGVELRGGYFKRSVFLEKANMGLGAQIREGCLLEEEANGAHCVGLKQTILFPFVTLGSLINFCDCLMAGGTSRKDHSEVGSSYVHFNYTPDGDKTTPSLFGDVPRGVMLDQPPIFLGGQGGAVGPVRVGYGTVVAAGSVLRHDVPEDGKLVCTAPLAPIERDRIPFGYRSLSRVVGNNVRYLANLAALEHWYREVRAPFFARQEFGTLVYEGALEVLSLAKKERVTRLTAMAGKVSTATPGHREFAERVGDLCNVFSAETTAPESAAFVGALKEQGATSGNYTETMQSLAPEVKAEGVQWLERIVETLCSATDATMPSLDMFGKRS